MNSFISLTGNFPHPSLFAWKLCWAIVMLAAGGCSNEPAKANEVPVVVVTTTHLSDLVHSLAGKHVKVISLMGPGVDPHLYKPTSRDLSSLAKADLIVFHGLMLEGRMGHALEQADKKGISSIAATSEIPKSLILSGGDEGADGHEDPHVWFSPEIWSICVNTVMNKLIELDPESESEIRENAQGTLSELEEIKAWSLDQVRQIPQERRKLVTSHDAFRYFGKDLGLEVIGLQGMSTNVEAGLADRANLVDFIKEQNIPAIFVETSVNPAAMNQIAKESGVVIGGELFSDALGSPDESAIGPAGKSFDLDSWGGMMVHNVSTIVEALGTKDQP
ncbi:MAG: zinc ABC transporter solute-binding protein [Opitutae bacterium]|nr:zinc ABC transporter solute-binding protein [Opitutae bacterium]